MPYHPKPNVLGDEVGIHLGLLNVQVLLDTAQPGKFTLSPAAIFTATLIEKFIAILIILKRWNNLEIERLQKILYPG
jgi:hypothetical protein